MIRGYDMNSLELKNKLDMACENFAKALKNGTTAYEENTRKWIQMSLESTQKRAMLAKQNKRVALYI